MADKQNETKGQGKGKPSLDDVLNQAQAQIEEALETGERTTGGFDGPSWAPTLNPSLEANKAFRPEALKEKLEKLGKGSTWRLEIGGTLVAAHAWGRRLYFVDVANPGGDPIRVKVPESKILYAGLNLAPLNHKVALKLKGQGEAKKGRKAPWLYDVVVVGAKALSAPREDALEALSIDERDALKEAQERARQRRLGGGDADGAGDDETPF